MHHVHWGYLTKTQQLVVIVKWISHWLRNMVTDMWQWYIKQTHNMSLSFICIGLYHNKHSVLPIEYVWNISLSLSFCPLITTNMLSCHPSIYLLQFSNFAQSLLPNDELLPVPCACANIEPLKCSCAHNECSLDFLGCWLAGFQHALRFLYLSSRVRMVCSKCYSMDLFGFLFHAEIKHNSSFVHLFYFCWIGQSNFIHCVEQLK